MKKKNIFFRERATKTYPEANEFSQPRHTLLYILFNFILLHKPAFLSCIFPSGYFTEMS